ncbi:TetR/AcrR family transcriptional regulator [Magnetococcus sp. PR-3]|uniref:TetR/AcrR family transcriptional regulator n=1 Tax=Magnetococcus sp. PR-3 TaxID=3120355 RepID=UPI002FCDE4D5
MAKLTARERLIEAALTLFYREGFHATGIERVLLEAGVSKMTLYRHFQSKEDLILAALRRRDERFRVWLIRAIKAYKGDARSRLLGMFDALDAWFHGDGPGQLPFCGCMFIHAAGEYGELSSPIHTLAAEHKRLVLEDLRLLVAEAGLPLSFAEQLALLKEGAIVSASVTGDLSSALRAKQMAEVLFLQEERR